MVVFNEVAPLTGVHCIGKCCLHVISGKLTICEGTSSLSEKTRTSEDLERWIHMYRQMQVTGAVRTGVQYALVNPSNLTDASVHAVVTNAGTLAGLAVTSDLTDNCGCSDGTKFLCSSVTTCSAGTTGRIQRYATINASYTHTWIFYPGDTEITATATIRTQ